MNTTTNTTNITTTTTNITTGHTTDPTAGPQLHVIMAQAPSAPEQRGDWRQPVIGSESSPGPGRARPMRQSNSLRPMRATIGG